MSTERCHECWNLQPHCTCHPGQGLKPPAPPPPDPPGVVLERDLAMIDESGDPTSAVIIALGGDPQQSGLIWCPQCGITLDFECDYGGWHLGDPQKGARMLHVGFADDQHEGD